MPDGGVRSGRAAHRTEAPPAPATEPSGKYAFVKLRWKDSGESESRLASTPVTRADEVASLDGADEAFRSAAAVAGAGELLAGAPIGAMGWDRVIELADGARGRDADGTRAEFVGLAKDASAIAALRQVGVPGSGEPIPPSWNCRRTPAPASEGMPAMRARAWCPRRGFARLGSIEGDDP